MQISHMSLDTNILSLGAILGQSSSQSLINSINARCGGGSFFNTNNDPFRTGFEHFMQQVVNPIRNVGITLANTAKQIFQQDVMRPITTPKELERGIPPAMQLPIIYYPPIRQMLDEERIDGFGIDPATLEDEDPYATVLESDFVELHSTTVNAKGEFTMHHWEKSTDPELTEEEKMAIRLTREYIDIFMNDPETQSLDFTDYPNLHC